MCTVCARWVHLLLLEQGHTHLSRAFVSMQSRPNHPNYSQLGFRVLEGGFLALCFPSQLCIKCAFQSKSQLRWISVGLWVLAACAGRSTRSKGSQKQFALHALSPCQGCSKFAVVSVPLYLRLYPPAPFCRDARPSPSVGASSANADGQQRSRQLRANT